MNFKVELLSYEDKLADFEVTLENLDCVTCHAVVDLIDFKNGDVNIDPDNWFDAEGNSIDKPEEFKGYERHLLNNCFEYEVGKFL